jgi:hypothetical protein
MDPFTLAALISTIGNVGGGLIGGAGQSRMSAEERAHQEKMLRMQQQQQLGMYEQTRQDGLNKIGLDTANTTPDRVAWRQNMAMRNAIAPQMRNFSVGAPAGMSAYKPNISGGMRLPDGGLPPEALKFFTENAMLEGEKDLDLAGARASGGNYQVPSYGSIYGTPAASATQSHAVTAADNLRKLDEEAKRKRAMQGALTTPNGVRGTFWRHSGAPNMSEPRGED